MDKNTESVKKKNQDKAPVKKSQKAEEQFDVLMKIRKRLEKAYQDFIKDFK